MPTAVRNAQQRRDDARWRTRRLSWLIGSGAAAASAVLGVMFSQLLPGHTAAASTAAGTQPGAGRPAPAGGTRQHRPAAGQPAPAQPTQAPAPAPAPPQVVSGGS